MGTMLATTTNNHLQTIEQVEEFQKSWIARLCHYIDEHQRSLNSFIKSQSYGYNTSSVPHTKDILIYFRATYASSKSVGIRPHHNSRRFNYTASQANQNKEYWKIAAKAATNKNASGFAQKAYARHHKINISLYLLFQIGDKAHVDRLTKR